MRDSFFALLGLAAALALSSEAPLARKTSQDFVAEASLAARYELGAAELARERGGEAARAFAGRLRDDHVRLESQLRGIARSEGLRVPAELAPAQQALLLRLSQLEGEDFDREYAAQQLRAQAEAVALFARASAVESDARLRSFATDALPILQAGLQRARELAR